MKKLLPAVTAILLIVFTAVTPAGAEPAYDIVVVAATTERDTLALLHALPICHRDSLRIPT